MHPWLNHIKRIAYFIWRGLPPGTDLDDVQSEAVLGSLQAPEGLEVIAAKRAIYDYLRRCNPQSRWTGQQCHTTFWWMPTEDAQQERMAIDAEMRGRLLRAVDTLTPKELQVIHACFWEDISQREAAKNMGTSEAYFARVKAKTLRKLRVAVQV